MLWGITGCGLEVALPLDNPLFQLIHGPAFLAHRPMAFGMKPDLPLAAVRHSHMQDDVGHPSEHRCPAWIGFPLDLR